MNRLGAGALGYVQNLVPAKVGLGRLRWTDGVGFIGLADVERGAIDVGVDSDGGDAHFAAGADNAHRDLSPVSDQNLLEHTVPGPLRPIDFTFPAPGRACAKSRDAKSREGVTERTAAGVGTRGSVLRISLCQDAGAPPIAEVHTKGASLLPHGFDSCRRTTSES